MLQSPHSNSYSSWKWTWIRCQDPVHRHWGRTIPWKCTRIPTSWTHRIWALISWHTPQSLSHGTSWMLHATSIRPIPPPPNSTCARSTPTMSMANKLITPTSKPTTMDYIPVSAGLARGSHVHLETVPMHVGSSGEDLTMWPWLLDLREYYQSGMSPLPNHINHLSKQDQTILILLSHSIRPMCSCLVR